MLLQILKNTKKLDKQTKHTSKWYVLLQDTIDFGREITDH